MDQHHLIHCRTILNLYKDRLWDNYGIARGRVRTHHDLINKNDIDGALIFHDQEKALDRAEYGFLLKTMHAFGIGDVFIDWREKWQNVLGSTLHQYFRVNCNLIKGDAVTITHPRVELQTKAS